MLIKACGALLVGLCFLLLFYAYLEKEKRKKRESEAFLQLLRFMRAEISAFCTPTEKIYRRFQNEALASLGFLDALAGEGLASALDAYRNRLSVGEETFLLLREFAEELGLRFLGEELSRLDYYIEALEGQLSSLAKAAPQRARLLGSLLFSSAGMVIILLL